MNKKIVLLCSDFISTTIVYNRVNARFPIDTVIMEEPMRGMVLAKRRFKKLGFFRTSGQILFSLFAVPLIKLGSRKRIAQIAASYRFVETPIPESVIKRVVSANDETCINLLKELNPDIVLVNGTRILSKKVLESTGAVFINMHTGITPQYRGVHGGYWALVKDDAKRFGVTVHLVDKGVDTGAILYQSVAATTKKDNFVTYPYIQFGEGVPLVEQAVEDAINNSLKPVVPEGEKGAVWYHPTIWQYIYFRVFKGKK